MDKIIFTEEFCQPENLHPFTLTRQIQDIRIGILTIREKWEKMLGLPSFDRKEDDYKDSERSVHPHEAVKGKDSCYMIHGNILPTPKLVKAVKSLKNGEFISAKGNEGIVFRFSKHEISDQFKIKVTKAVPFHDDIHLIQYPWDIFKLNDWALRQDFSLLTRKRRSAALPKSNKATGSENIFIEKGAKLSHCVINADNGPVYIGRDAEIMEGCLIRGPFALCEGAVLKMGTKIYGATTVGPYSIVGGEIKNVVLFGYSNKAHDGYLGDAVVGEWCNMGAGTSNSNLKNSAGTIKVMTLKGEVSAGVKCGVMMGDYSRTAINTSINTGTIIGICAHVFGNGLTPKHIPSFSWGSEGIKRYDFDMAIKHIEAWKKLKGHAISENERSILHYIFNNY